MPLLIICGLPSSGKTTLANLILQYYEPDKKCVMVSDTDLLKIHGRNNVFKDRNLEKEVRGSLKSQVITHLNQGTLVILDSGNYIKGYRYELYCQSKEYKTTHCIVECLANNETLVTRNDFKTVDEKYDMEVLNALIRRFESPDSRNRWDSPHIGIQDDNIPFEEISRVLFDRCAPPPNLSTQSRPVSDSSYLQIVDSETRRVVDCYLKAQDAGQTTLILPGAKSNSLSLKSTMSPAQLNKLRRQYLTYVKMHPPTKQDEIVSSFIQFISSNSD